MKAFKKIVNLFRVLIVSPFVLLVMVYVTTVFFFCKATGLNLPDNMGVPQWYDRLLEILRGVKIPKDET